MRIIKKYPNRRLYDTDLGTYITLDDVKDLVFKRIDFRVVDAKTKEDLTQSTLLQIILEQEGKSNPLFTIPMLREFICFYNEKSKNVFGQYLHQAFDMFNQQKDFFQQQWHQYRDMMSPKKSSPRKKK